VTALEVLSISLLIGCTDSPGPPRTGTVEEVFEEVRRVILDDAPIATIGQLRDFVPYGTRFLVADGMTDRVLSFTEEGEFERAIGRRGDGPGEFKTPMSLLVDRDSSILATDLSARITRLSPSLELSEVYRLNVALWAQHLAGVEGRILLYVPTGREAGENFVWWDPADGLGASFDPVSQLVQTVPYWSATWQTLVAVGDENIVVADNMVYPLRRYTLMGELVDTFGVAPPSWRQADKPEVGEFATPEGQRRGQGWTRSYTLIDGLFTVSGEWLVVTHRDPVGEYSSDDIIRADVYRTGSWEKVWEDIQLPSPVIRGGECAWLAVARPPEAWTLACWRVRDLSEAG
jgi:hypothetical protein